MWRTVLLPAAVAVALLTHAGVLDAQSVTRRLAPPDSAMRVQRASFERAMQEMRSTNRASFDSTTAFFAFATHMRLARLGYISGPFDLTVSDDLARAIRRYQEDRGLVGTGDPTSFDLSRALAEDEQAMESPPHLPNRIVSILGGLVQLRGTWRFAGIGNQFISMEMTCRRHESRCYETQAILRPGIIGGQSLDTDTQEWIVSSWDDVEISTEPVDFTCARYRLRINLVQQTATKTRSTISSAPDCSHQVREDLVITLEDGPTVLGELAAKRNALPFPALLSPAAARIFNQGSQPRP